MQPGELRVKLHFTLRSQTIRLLITCSISLLKAFDPSVFEEPPNRPVKGSCAKPGTATGELFDIFEKRITMLRLGGEAGQDENDGLAERLLVLYDMSHGDMLHCGVFFVKWDRFGC
jgi:hypothetical protein